MRLSGESCMNPSTNMSLANLKSLDILQPDTTPEALHHMPTRFYENRKKRIHLFKHMFQSTDSIQFDGDKIIFKKIGDDSPCFTIHSVSDDHRDTLQNVCLALTEKLQQFNEQHSVYEHCKIQQTKHKTKDTIESKQSARKTVLNTKDDLADLQLAFSKALGLDGLAFEMMRTTFFANNDLEKIGVEGNFAVCQMQLVAHSKDQVIFEKIDRSSSRLSYQNTFSSAIFDNELARDWKLLKENMKRFYLPFLKSLQGILHENQSEGSFLTELESTLYRVNNKKDLELLKQQLIDTLHVNKINQDDLVDTLISSLQKSVGKQINLPIFQHTKKILEVINVEDMTMSESKKQELREIIEDASRKFNLQNNEKELKRHIGEVLSRFKKFNDERKGIAKINETFKVFIESSFKQVEKFIYEKNRLKTLKSNFTSRLAPADFIEDLRHTNERPLVLFPGIKGGKDPNLQDRSSCTEAKMLTRIIKVLSKRKDIGDKINIRIHTEREACVSCRGAMKQFLFLYPKALITVTNDNQYPKEIYISSMYKEDRHQMLQNNPNTLIREITVDLKVKDPQDETDKKQFGQGREWVYAAPQTLSTGIAIGKHKIHRLVHHLLGQTDIKGTHKIIVEEVSTSSNERKVFVNDSISARRIDFIRSRGVQNVITEVVPPEKQEFHKCKHNELQQNHSNPLEKVQQEYLEKRAQYISDLAKKSL